MFTNFMRAIARPLAAIAMLLLSAGQALAQNMMPGPNGSSSGVWTVYGFGNSQALADTFRGLANFTASSTFQSLVLLIAMIGVLAVGVSSGFSGAMARKFIGYITTVFIITYVFFGVGGKGALSVNVEIEDTLDGRWVGVVTVPAVVGIPAAVISTAGHEIMAQIEASFPIPDSLKMSNGAPFNLAAAMLNDASKAKITDANLSSSLSMYVQDCFIPAVVRGEKDVKTLLTSSNFIPDLLINNQALMVNTFLPSGQADIVSCVVAHQLITAAVNAGGEVADYLNSATAWANTPALSVVGTAMADVARYATNSGVTDGAALVKQSAVLASFSGAYRQAAAQTGNSDFLTALSLSQAHQSQVSSWIVGAEVFNRMMGYVFAVLQVFVYAITPLILAAALIPGVGASLMKNFVQILLWLAIWQPMLAIVNFIVLSMQQADLGGALSSGGGAYGFTLQNMGIISEKTANLRAAATFVGTMVPALAWAMVKGSIDFSRVIGSAVGENFAQGAANTMATGNYSLNSASMDSFTANKHSLGQTFDAGGGIQASPTGNGAINQTKDVGGTEAKGSGQSAGVRAAREQAVGDSAQAGKLANRGHSGAITVNSGYVAALAQGTQDLSNAGGTDASGTMTGLTGAGNLTADGRVALVKPAPGAVEGPGAAIPQPTAGDPALGGTPADLGGTPAAPGGTPAAPGGTPAAPGGTPAAAPATPTGPKANSVPKGARLKKGQDRLSAGVGTSLTGAATAGVHRSHTDTAAQVTSATGGATFTNTGGTAATAQVNAGVTDSAGQTDAANDTRTQGVMALPPRSENLDAQASAMQMRTSIFSHMRPADPYQPGIHRLSTTDTFRTASPTARAAAKLSESGNFGANYAGARETLAAKEAAYAKEAKALEMQAAAKAAENEQAALAKARLDREQLAKAAPLSTVAPLARVTGAAKALFQKHSDATAELLPAPTAPPLALPPLPSAAVPPGLNYGSNSTRGAQGGLAWAAPSAQPPAGVGSPAPTTVSAPGQDRTKEQVTPLSQNAPGQPPVGGGSPAPTTASTPDQDRTKDPVTTLPQNAPGQPPAGVGSPAPTTVSAPDQDRTKEQVTPLSQNAPGQPPVGVVSPAPTTVSAPDQDRTKEQVTPLSQNAPGQPPAGPAQPGGPDAPGDQTPPASLSLLQPAALGGGAGDGAIRRPPASSSANGVAGEGPPAEDEKSIPRRSTGNPRAPE